MFDHRERARNEVFDVPIEQVSGGGTGIRAQGTFWVQRFSSALRVIPEIAVFPPNY